MFMFFYITQKNQKDAKNISRQQFKEYKLDFKIKI
jgi:hypothetical protein